MDNSSDESMSSESTFNEDFGNVDAIIQQPVQQTEHQPTQKMEQKNNLLKKKPVDDKMLKARQLITLEDVNDYELENPRENKNYGYFGEVTPLIIEKNLSPLKVYIYGNYPHFQKSTTYYMLRKAGVEINNKLNGKYDMGIFWDPRMDINKQTPKLKQNGKKIKLVNLFLVDTSKDFVAKSFENHFGYGYHVDPTTFDGYCISKHNGNGTKSCFFLKCPINATDIFKDHSYQRIIDYTDKRDPDTLYELRVPIVGGIIPCILFKTRNRGLRFTSKNRSIQIVNPLKYLTEQECNKIITYCRYIGLELGEIDILRSHEDGKIYIIDVNNTSWWPPNKLGDVERNIVLNLMWNAFLESFLPNHYKKYSVPDNMIDDFVYTKKTEKNDRKKIVYKYRENRFLRNQYKIQYKVMWRQLYHTGEDINFEEENEQNEQIEDNKTELESIVSSKIIEEHEEKMKKMFKKQPYLSKMFMNEKIEKEKEAKEAQEKERNKSLQKEAQEKSKLLKKQEQEKLQPNLVPIQNIMNPQLMEQFQSFLKFQQIQSNMNQQPIVQTSVPTNEIKSFREFTNNQEKSEKQTEIIIKQNRPQNLAKQKESLMKILSRR